MQKWRMRGITMSNNSYYVDFIFDEFPVLAKGINPSTGASMSFEDARAEIIDWLERELEAAKQMQEEEHHADDQREYWEDHCS